MNAAIFCLLTQTVLTLSLKSIKLTVEETQHRYESTEKIMKRIHPSGLFTNLYSYLSDISTS